MKGIRSDWASMNRLVIHTQTSSSSGEERQDTFFAVPLLSALNSASFSTLRIRSEDGYGLLLSYEDCLNAYLSETTDHQILVILSKDTNRKRWIRSPVEFLMK